MLPGFCSETNTNANVFLVLLTSRRRTRIDNPLEKELVNDIWLDKNFFDFVFVSNSVNVINVINVLLNQSVKILTRYKSTNTPLDKPLDKPLEQELVDDVNNIRLKNELADDVNDRKVFVNHIVNEFVNDFANERLDNELANDINDFVIHLVNDFVNDFANDFVINFIIKSRKRDVVLFWGYL